MVPPPQPKITIDQPQAGAQVWSGQEFTASGTWSGKSASAWIEGQDHVAATTSGNTWSAKLTALTPGPATLVAHAASFLPGAPGKTTEIALNVLDSTGPSAGVVAPTAQAPASTRTFELVVSATDPETGVAAVECAFLSPDFVSMSLDAATSTWRATLTLPDATVSPEGDHHTVTIRARNPSGAVVESQGDLVFRDVTPPTFSFTPVHGSQQSGTVNGATVQVIVTPTDPADTLLSCGLDTTDGASTVEVGVDGQNFVVAKPIGGGQWAADVHVDAHDRHAITVRCRDRAGNQSVDSHDVVVVVPQVISDLGVQSYLRDLLEFAQRRVRTGPDGGDITTAHLDAAYGQPFGRLATGPAADASRPVPALAIAFRAIAAQLELRRRPPLASWALDEGSGTTAHDRASGQCDGTIAGASWVSGRDGAPALSFDGNDAVDVGQVDTILASGRMSVSAWVKVTDGGPPAIGMIVCREQQYAVAQGTDGTVLVAFAGSGDSWQWIATGVALPIRWCRLVVTREDTTVRIYIDGQPRAFAIGPPPPADPSDRDPVRIGNSQTGTLGFRGALSDVAFHDVALTDWEARAEVEPPRDDDVWLDDALSPTATAYADGGDAWEWTTTPAPVSGTQVHRSQPAAGVHQHFFVDTDTAFAVDGGDILTTWVRLDPTAPPREVMLQWQTTDGSWDHRAFWGEDLIGWGSPGTVSRHRMGGLPDPGRWVRLEVPAAAVGLERRLVRGLAFTLYGGGAAWDASGRTAWRPRVAASGHVAAGYLAALTEAGTSYTELRLARGGSPRQRAEMADRLRIALTPGSADELDQLLEDLNGLTEADTSAMFGVPPLLARAPADGTPTLEAWRLDRLRRQWRDEDHGRPDAPPPRPVLDPDITARDEIDPAASTVTALWGSRAGWLDMRRAELGKLLDNGGAPVDAVDSALAKVLGAGAVTDVVTRRDGGYDIAPDLDALRLSFRPFDRLVELRALAANGALRPAERDDLLDILVQVLKETRADGYAQWLQDERSKDLVLDPTVFTAHDAGARPLNPWRAQPQARLAWEARLATRSDELADLRTGMQAIADAGLTASLAPAAAALVSVAAGGAAPGADAADALTALLQLDAKVSPGVVTTPLAQAIETLQGVLFAVRTGQVASTEGLPPGPASTWRLDLRRQYEAAQFDAEWQWMGSYATWRSAMSAFIWPENLLVPELLEPKDAPPSDPLRMTSAFDTFLTDVADAEPTPDALRKTARDYLTNVTAEFPNQAVLAGLELTDQVTEQDLTALAQRTAQSAEVAAAKAFTELPNWFREVFFYAPLHLGLTLSQAGQHLSALDWMRRVFAYDRAGGQEIIFAGLKVGASTPPEFRRPLEWLLGDALNPHRVADTRANVPLRFVMLTVAEALLDFADSEFTLDVAESRPRARSLYLAAQDVLRTVALRPSIDESSPQVPLNPRIETLAGRAQLNLLKLRLGLDISGMQRPLETPPSAETNGSQPSVVLRQPTPYRYATLVARAQQMLTTTAQIEAQYLASLEKADAETYNLMRAGQDLELARERVTLQQTQAQAADKEIDLARGQRDRASLQQTTYDHWIAAGPNQYERAMLDSYRDERKYRDQIANLDAMLAATQAFTSAASAMSSMNPAGLFSAFGAAVSADLSAGKADATVGLNDAEYRAQVNAFMGSSERRTDEWRFQSALAAKDVLIGQTQVDIAQLRAGAAHQEVQIAQTQQAHAEAAVHYLATKFTSADLYRWMSGVLGGVYRSLLQQATAVARLAQRQLAFERQESTPAYIKSDYWTAPTAVPAAEPTDRRGLTGTARLVRDLAELDQYAFDTNRRKLQLSQTFSLAGLAPVDFQRFRRTGVLPFRTPVAELDRCFPGHYLRTLRRVRVSIVGLIPPTTGVRASLWSGGISQTVVEAGGFSAVTISRPPELVALTSPSGATGVFELDPQAELMLPFEGSGLDCAWELRLPKYANPFNFASIADVLVTFEYTARHSEVYAQTVLRRLSPQTSNTLSYSLRNDFPEEWYGLVTAAVRDEPLTATLELQRSDFPPNLENLYVEHVALMVIPNGDATPPPLTMDSLHLDGRTPLSSSGPAPAVGGLISTRNGTGSTWHALTDPAPSPVGTWTATIADMPQLRKALAGGGIRDLVFAYSYGGRFPDWDVLG